MTDNIFGCFVSGPAVYGDSSTETINESERLGEEFVKFMWGSNRLCEILKQLKHQDYGTDLTIILFQFYLNPIPEQLSYLKEIGSYRRKEKSIGIPVIVDNHNFFTLSDIERRIKIVTILKQKLNLVESVIKRNKLDTKFNELKVDFSKILDSFLNEKQNK